MTDTLLQYWYLVRGHRPIGFWLLFWPCALSLTLVAAGSGRGMNWLALVLCLVGAIAMRGAGCTFNDIVDADIDEKVARTRGRPIPSGAISASGAARLVAALCLIGLAILLQLNAITMALGAASLLLVAAYPFMKRITWWPQAWLGLTFNWGALMGYAAQTGTLGWASAMLYAGLVFWTLGYDTIYALQDKDDDALIGVKSTARLFGDKAPRWVMRFYVIAFVLILAAGYAAHMGWLFTPLMLLAGANLLWQARKVDANDPDLALRLFRANRDTGALIAAAFLGGNWFF